MLFGFQMGIETNQVVSIGMEDCFYFVKESLHHGGLGIPAFAASLGQKMVGKELFVFIVLGLDLGSALFGVLVILQSGCASEFDLKSITCRNVQLFHVRVHSEL